MIENYHTHHNFCGHAEGYAWDYVEEAIKLGFSVLGISDHAPNKLINDWGVRMKESQLDEYLADIESARKKAGKKPIKKGKSGYVTKSAIKRSATTARS